MSLSAPSSSADVYFAHKDAKGQQEFLKIELKDAYISSYKTSSGGGGRPTETLVLTGDKADATFLNGNSQSNILLKQVAT